MSDRKLIAIPMVAGIVLTGGVAFAEQPSTDKVVKQLEARIAELEAKQQTTVTKADLSASVASVLDDAEKRSTLLQAGTPTAGFLDGKFTIASADGAYTFNPTAQFQFRSVFNYVETDDDDEATHGFELRRMKFGFEGSVIDEKLKYKFVLQNSRSNGNTSLQDAFISYMFSDAWGFRVGQFKDPVFHEELTSSSRQLAVDRSLANEVLGGGLTDRVQGVALLYNEGKLRGEVAFHDGIGSINSNFQDADVDFVQSVGGGLSVTEEANYGFGGRVEYMVLGDSWRPYRDFTARGTEEDILVIGAGADYTEAGDTYTVSYTVDGQYENATGLGVFAAFLGKYTDFGEDLAGDDVDGADFGVVLQVGYAIPDTNYEVFGRYSGIFLDDDLVAADDEDVINEITAGFNYYFKSHNAKMTIDVVYLPDGLNASNSGLGLLSSEDDQFAIRGQFQLVL
ncbi:MAG: porin [Phycisphaerae bacterium]